MMTCSIDDRLDQTQAELSEWFNSWVAADKPKPLDFMVRFAGRWAESLREAGQTDRWIRDTLEPIMANAIATYPASVRPTFLEAIERRLAIALPPIGDASPTEPRKTDPGQAAYDRWIEESASAEDSPITLLICDVKGFARTLRSMGKTDEAIRARVEELDLPSGVVLNPADRDRIARLVQQAVDEALGQNL